MTKTTAVQFIKEVTNDHTVNENDNRIESLFKDYDADKDGFLKEDEFLKFYTDKAQEKPDAVWNNLTCYGYTNDLRMNTTYVYNENDPYEILDQTVLPRYKLSSDPKIFELFFNIIDKLKPNFGQEDIWNIICLLKTSPKIYASLLSHSLTPEISKQRNFFEKLYSLQVI